jgi:hypothetical protein
MLRDPAPGHGEVRLAPEALGRPEWLVCSLGNVTRADAGLRSGKLAILPTREARVAGRCARTGLRPWMRVRPLLNRVRFAFSATCRLGMPLTASRVPGARALRRARPAGPRVSGRPAANRPLYPLDFDVVFHALAGARVLAGATGLTSRGRVARPRPGTAHRRHRARQDQHAGARRVLRSREIHHAAREAAAIPAAAADTIHRTTTRRVATHR